MQNQADFVSIRKVTTAIKEIHSSKPFWKQILRVTISIYDNYWVFFKKKCKSGYFFGKNTRRKIDPHEFQAQTL